MPAETRHPEPTPQAAPPPAPLITIVTATFNAAAGLATTWASIRAQTFDAFEWVVIDGGSTDGTVELLRGIEAPLRRWVSEPDGGLYDAFNKGCQLARGQWVQFLGAGDRLAGPRVLEQAAGFLRAAPPDCELAYGRLTYLARDNRTVVREVGVPWSEMNARWTLFHPALPVHPEVFHHRELLTGDAPFDKRLRIAADTKLMLRSVLEREPLFMPIMVTMMPLDGVSSTLQGYLAAARESRAIAAEFGLRAPPAHWLREHLRLLLKFTLVRALPPRHLERLLDWSRRLRARTWRG